MPLIGVPIGSLKITLSVSTYATVNKLLLPASFRDAFSSNLSIKINKAIVKLSRKLSVAS